MKAILQNLKNGETLLEDVPSPALNSHSVLVQTTKTLISSGTEKMVVDFGKAGLIGKIKKQPDKVKIVLDKIKTDGLKSTYETIQSKLDQPISLGYCNVGRVVGVGSGTHGFKVGMRVVSNGHHAQVVRVAPTLCCPIPEGVSDEQAAFSVVGAIALQGVRLSQPGLGETFVVMGLGLIGLLTVQLLRASGCRVIGFDFDESKLKLAEAYGAEVFNLGTQTDPLAFTQKMTQEQGVDGVILTLATQSHEPIHLSAQMCRKRGRIVLVGVTGLNLQRADFYEKELTFQVSCSYGPGRYDPVYEKGEDYPFGFVRWTAQRNMIAFLDLLKGQRVSVDSLISHRFDIDQTSQAYALLHSNTPHLGIVLNFENEEEVDLDTKTISYPHAATEGGKVRVGFIGAGGYALRFLLPSLKKTGADLVSICSSGGVSAAYAARKFGFRKATTDLDSLFLEKEMNTLFVATRHNSHAHLVCRGLEEGKHVFVEKPLALTQSDLDRISTLYRSLKTPPLLMVGFNRRFSPFTQKMKSLLETTTGPKSFIMTVNVGEIPASHWTQDLHEGGGRILGEGCHFIDLLRFLSASPIQTYSYTGFRNPTLSQSDCASLSLVFEDGSFGTIHYLSNGHTTFPKERLEVFVDGKILQLDNFRQLKGWGWKSFSNLKRFSQDKGQEACVKAFYQALSEGGESPIPFEELMEVSRVSIALGEMATVE